MEENITDTIKQETERIMKQIAENGLDGENIEILGKAVDIHKDLANEEYWKNKEEVMDMRYGNYGRDSYREGSLREYGRRRRDSRGRYMESGRGQRYRGHDMIDEMSEHYGNYSEGRGNYGAKEETMMSLEYMLESMVDFVEMLQQEADSQEEVNLIRKYTKKISEM